MIQANPVANVLDDSPETFLSSDENVDHQLLVKAVSEEPETLCLVPVDVNTHMLEDVK